MMSRRAKARDDDTGDEPPGSATAASPRPFTPGRRGGGGKGGLPLLLGSLVSLSVAGLLIAASTVHRQGGGADSAVDGRAGDAAAPALVGPPAPSPLPIRFVKLPGSESDDDTDLPEAEDDDDGVASALRHMGSLLRQQQPPGVGAAGLSAAALRHATVVAPLSKRNPVLAAECARRLSGSAYMDFDRVLLPAPTPLPADVEDALASAGPGGGVDDEGEDDGGAPRPLPPSPSSPPAQAPPPPPPPPAPAGGGSALLGRVVPNVHTLPQTGTIGGLHFFRPLTLLLDAEHLLIGDLFLASPECLVFVTVKNKAQPDWLLLRRVLIEHAGDNETIVTPFTSVASSLADPREPVGVGKYCYKGFARGRAVNLTVVYRGQRWPVTVHRAAGRGSSVFAMTTLVGHNWRLLPAWVAYWRKLGAGHFYLYFNEYLARIAGEGADGAALLAFLRASADFVTVFEWPFKFDIRVKVQKAGGDARLRLQHLAQPLRAHSAFYRFRSAHRYMLFFDVDEYLVPAAGGSGVHALADIVRGTARQERLAPVYSFSNRWAAAPLPPAASGLLQLRDLAAAGVYSDRDVVLGKRTKYAVATRSKVVFVHIHKATTSTEFVRASTHHVPPSVASFLHLTNLDPCHGSLDVDVVAAQRALTADPARRDARMNELLVEFTTKRARGGRGGGGAGAARADAPPPPRLRRPPAGGGAPRLDDPEAGVPPEEDTGSGAELPSVWRPAAAPAPRGGDGAAPARRPQVDRAGPAPPPRRGAPRVGDDESDTEGMTNGEGEGGGGLGEDAASEDAEGRAPAAAAAPYGDDGDGGSGARGGDGGGARAHAGSGGDDAGDYAAPAPARRVFGGAADGAARRSRAASAAAAGDEEGDAGEDAEGDGRRRRR